MYLPPPTTNRAPINVVLSLGVGNHVDLRRLPGGAEGIRNDGHRGRWEISRLILSSPVNAHSAPITSFG
jgi:hypothetical protein